MKKYIYLLLTIFLTFGISWKYGKEIQNYIIPTDLFNILNKVTQEKIISLSEDLYNRKDPSFESVSNIFPDYMKYPKTVVGVKEHPDRFLSSWDGAIVFPPMYISFEVNDTPFGAVEETVSRSLWGDYLPIVVTNYEYNGLIYEQTIFGYSEDFLTENPLLAFVRMKVKNPSEQKKETKLSVWFRGIGAPEAGFWWSNASRQIIHCPRKLSLKDNIIINENGDIAFWSDIQADTFEEDKLSFEFSLAPNEEKMLHFRIPNRSLRPEGTGRKSDIHLLSEPSSFNEALEIVSNFWKEVQEHRMQVDVPENMINNAYKTWHINNFLLVHENKKRFSYGTYGAPFFYGQTAGYAGAMYLNTLTTGGYYNEAKKVVRMFTRQLQRTNGAFSGEAAQDVSPISKESIIPHQHGSILYTICQVYRKERDDEWFKTVVPDILRACEWIIRERSLTKDMTNGKKPVTYGMLPEYRYCVDMVAGSTYDQEYLGNAWCWAGLQQAAIALGELGSDFEKESLRLQKEADEYREDIFASMDKAVIKQGDMSFLPMVLTNKKPFNNLQESRLALYYNILSPRMLESNIFDLNDERIHWIPNFLENRGGLILGMARFGQSKWLIDPHFIAGYGITNLRINKIDKFLLTFYGLISYGMSRELYSTQEVDNILTGGPNLWYALRQPHLHSTSQMIRLTNIMLIHEEKEEIWLTAGVPRKWLENGKIIEVKRAQTCFGPFDFRIESNVLDGFIKAKISTTIKKAPSAIKLKLRHPEAKNISKVEINETKWKDFDGEIINLPCNKEDYIVVAYYEHE